MSSRIVVVTTLTGLACALATGVAAADSIYLKSGRVIHTSEARIDGDRVVFTQFGSLQIIPLTVVERVVDDDRVGPGVTPPPGGADLAGLDSVGETAPGAGAAVGGELGELSSLVDLGARLGALQNFQAGGQVDPAQALGALQALGSDTLLPLAAQLGTLTGAAAPGSDLAGADKLVPLIGRLGTLLAAPSPSPEATTEVVEELLRGLFEIGVTPEMIEERARALGIPLGGLQIPGRR